jgi:hypothetical protein
VNEATAKRGRLQLLLLALVFFGPLVVAIAMYYTGGARGASVNYGAVLDPPVTLDAKLHFDTDTRGRWTLLLLPEGDCGEACANTLIDMRQIRLATGREIERIERMIVLEAPLPQDTLDLHPGLRVMVSGDALTDSLISAMERLKRDQLYIMDPIGNVILAYPLQPERKPFLKDLRKLLKLSRIG